MPRVEALSLGSSAATEAVVTRVRAAARDANWQQIYTEAEVGRDFLDRYGWFELLGPTGHFMSDSLRAYIAFWDAGLHYPRHLHEAEELYFVLAGTAEFHAQGEPSVRLGAGGSRHHYPNQPHAMDTPESAVLTLVLWRGSDLAGEARIEGR